jgi:putative two-component system response regulator
LIAVVEDHHDTSSAIARLLRRDGLEAAVFPCGDELLAALNTGVRFKLILLDLSMPGMDGMQCLAAVQEHAEWRHIPVLIYSAEFDDAKRRQAMAMGARDYLVKGTLPWTDLLKRIREHAVG